MGVRVSGLATGLDTAALIEAFIAFERRPLNLVEARRDQVETQQSLFRELNTKLLAIKDAASAIDNYNSLLTGPTLDEELLDFTTSSSDDKVLTANATGNATPGTLDVEVTQLASVGRRFSTTQTADDTVIANSGETLTVDYGGGVTIDITIGASGATLQDLKNAINTDANNNGNVRADILFDGTNYRLIVSGANTGLANDVSVTSTISGGAFIDGALDQIATDAQIKVFGSISVSRSENDITDVIPGLTLKLHSADPGNPVTLDVQRDDTEIAKKFQALVDAYNAVIDFINTQSRFDPETKKAGPLSGNPTLRGLQATLIRGLQGSSGSPYVFAGNPLRSVSEFGISVGSDGRLSFDKTKMTEALDEDPFAVREFLSGDGTTDGAALGLAKAIQPFTQSVTGILASIDTTLDARLSNFDIQIERFERRLEKREELLVLRFARLEAAIAALQSQGGALAGLLIPRSV